MRLRDYEDIALALATAYGYVVALDVVGALLRRARTGEYGSAMIAGSAAAAWIAAHDADGRLEAMSRAARVIALRTALYRMMDQFARPPLGDITNKRKRD